MVRLSKLPQTFIGLRELKEKILNEIISILETDDIQIDLENLDLDIEYEVIVKINSIKLYRSE